MSCEDLDLRLGNVLKCIDNFKYLLAKKQYLILTSLLSQYENDSSDPARRKYASQIKLKLAANNSYIDTMLNRCEDVERAFEITSESSNDWIFGSEISGITTHYKVDDDGLINLRVEGILYVREKIKINHLYLCLFLFFVHYDRTFLYMNNCVLFMK